jgi:hypothetical protein
MTYREPGEAGTLLLAPLPCPAHVGAGGALGGQRTAAPAQALRRTRRTRVTLRKEMINNFEILWDMVNETTFSFFLHRAKLNFHSVYDIWAKVCETGLGALDESTLVS